MEGEGKEDQREVLEMEGQEPNDFIMNDEEPAFIEADEAVEVVVDDDNVPMDDADDDDDEGGDGMDNERMDGNVGGDMGTDNTDGMVDLSKFKIDCHTGPVYALAAYLDNSMNLTAVSGGGDDKAFLHRCQRGESPSTMELSHQHTDSVSCVALNLEYASEDLSKTPHFCAVGGYDGAIVVYDPTSGEKIKELEGPSDVEWLAFHPKGGMVSTRNKTLSELSVCRLCPTAETRCWFSSHPPNTPCFPSYELCLYRELLNGFLNHSHTAHDFHAHCVVLCSCQRYGLSFPSAGSPCGFHGGLYCVDVSCRDVQVPPSLCWP